MKSACGIILSLVGATLALPGNFQVKDLDDCTVFPDLIPGTTPMLSLTMTMTLLL